MQLAFIKTTVIFTVQRWVFHSVKALLNPSRFSVKKNTLFVFQSILYCNAVYLKNVHSPKNFPTHHHHHYYHFLYIKTYYLEISQVSKQFGRRLSKFATVLIWVTTELKIQKYQGSLSLYIYNWNNFSCYQKNQFHQIFIKIQHA